MRGHSALLPRLPALAALCLCAPAATAPAAEVYITRTTPVERWITNLIEVRMPSNRFVNEIRTNWVTQIRTNVVHFDVTNWLTRTLTNIEVVDAFRTNFAEVYATNWQTVLVLKTNWVAQTLTNISAVDLPADPDGAGASSLTPKRPAPPAPAAGPAPAYPDGLLFEAAKSRRPGTAQSDVELKARLTDDPTPLLVRQWRVESEDGAILSFSQNLTFKRELPAGRYKVAFKAQRVPDGPLMAAAGTLTVTPDTASFQRKTADAR
jgi:hypothetical protein